MRNSILQPTILALVILTSGVLARAGEPGRDALVESLFAALGTPQKEFAGCEARPSGVELPRGGEGGPNYFQLKLSCPKEIGMGIFLTYDEATIRYEDGKAIDLPDTLHEVYLSSQDRALLERLKSRALATPRYLVAWDESASPRLALTVSDRLSSVEILSIMATNTADEQKQLEVLKRAASVIKLPANEFFEKLDPGMNVFVINRFRAERGKAVNIVTLIAPSYGPWWMPDSVYQLVADMDGRVLYSQPANSQSLNRRAWGEYRDLFASSWSAGGTGVYRKVENWLRLDLDQKSLVGTGLYQLEQRESQGPCEASRSIKLRDTGDRGSDGYPVYERTSIALLGENAEPLCGEIQITQEEVGSHVALCHFDLAIKGYVCEEAPTPEPALPPEPAPAP